MLGDPPLSEGPGELPISLQEGEPDASHLASWSLTSEEGCERLRISLSTAGGAPARQAGEVKALILREEGVIRIMLDPAIETTSVVDHRFEGSLVEASFVVRSQEGLLFVDLHLAAPSAARVFVDRSPAVITIDLAPGAEPIGSPEVGDQVVITQPTGFTQTYPLRVQGYARSSLVTAQVRSSQTGSELVEDETSSLGDLWGEYDLVVPTGPVGTVSLVVNGSEGAATKVIDIR